MKNFAGITLLGLSLLGQSAMAGVTPAHLAMAQVKAFLDTQVEQEIQNVIPQHKAANHLIQFQSYLTRGKFSEGDGNFAQFFGNTEVLIQIGATETYYEVSCRTSATTVVAGFAMQMVPILEEVTNDEQLLLKKHSVKCQVAQ